MQDSGWLHCITTKMQNLRKPGLKRALWWFALILAAASLCSRLALNPAPTAPALDSVEFVWCNLREDGPLSRTQVRFVIDGDGSVVQLAAPCLGSEPLQLETRIPRSSTEVFYELVRMNAERPSKREGVSMCHWGSFGEARDGSGQTIEFDIDQPLKGWIETEFRDELACLRAERDVRESRLLIERTCGKDKNSEGWTEVCNQQLREALARSKAHPWPGPGESSSR